MSGADTDEPTAATSSGASAADGATDGTSDGAGSIVRASALVAVGTGLSRLTGLVRVGALAYALGAGYLADAYNLANTTPNIVYELLLGGVLSATLVPIFVELHRSDDRDDAAGAVIGTALATAAILSILAVAAAPLVIRLYTVRLDSADADALEPVAVALLRLLLPQVFFYGLTTVVTALLHARRRFTAAAFAPVLNNVVVSAILVALPHLGDDELDLAGVRGDPLLVLLGLGTTAGIAAMSLALLPALRRSGGIPRLRVDLAHPAVRRVTRMSGWTLGYVAANQAALFVVLALAVGAGEGGASAYTYAFIFFQLPHGLFAVSLMTTFSPELAAAVTETDPAAFRRHFSHATRLLTLLVLPAAAGYVLLADPVVSMLLERGAFGDASATATAEVLRGLAFGLPGFSLYLFVLRGFYAHHDTRTPFLLNAGENTLNVAFAVILVDAHGVKGLAWAYAAAYTVAAGAALTVLWRRMGGLDDGSLAASMGRTAVATAVMVGAVVGLDGLIDEGDVVIRAVAGALAGACVYGLALVALRSPEIADLTRRLRRVSA